MDGKNLEEKVKSNSIGVLKTAAKYLAVGFFALSAMGSGCEESECCQELACSGRYVCAGSGDYSSRHICITNSDGEEECCGCVLEGREPR